MFLSVKYDTYDNSFPTFGLNNGQDENVYMVDRCEDVDSYADMNSKFSMHCADLALKRNDKFEVTFPDLKVVNEPLTNDHEFSCLQEAAIRCNQKDVELWSFYEEIFLSSLQDNIKDEVFPFVQTSGQHVPDVPSF